MVFKKIYNNIKREYLFVFLVVLAALIIFNYFNDFNYTGLSVRESCYEKGYSCCMPGNGKDSYYFSLDNTCSTGQECWDYCGTSNQNNLITTKASFIDSVNNFFIEIKNSIQQFFSRGTVGTPGTLQLYEYGVRIDQHDWRYYSINNDPPHFYTFLNNKGRILKNPETGTIPIYRYQIDGDTYYYDTGGEINNPIFSQKPRQIIGYLYQNQETGTIPFYKFRYLPPYIYTMRYEFFSDSIPGYDTPTIEGYILPTKSSTPICGDNVIDSGEQCDGSSVADC
ncbi:MAG: hypothetical protein AABX61_00190, partial [Nanoarchaeota archaeon]